MKQRIKAFWREWTLEDKLAIFCALFLLCGSVYGIVRGDNTWALSAAAASLALSAHTRISQLRRELHARTPR